MPIVRRFQARPSLAELTAVSGVVIVDEPPAIAANAAPFGNTVCLGEFEDGPFNVVTQILSSRDMPRIFGGFGYDYAGQVHKYASAVQSGGVEPFNGSGYVQLARLPFGKLSICRVDTSVGQVSLAPLAYVQASGKLAPFVLDNGLTFIWERDGSAKTATFAATAAVKDGTGITYPTSFAGGEQLTVSLNGTATTVTFQAGDTTLANIIARINATFGFTFASSNAGQLRLTSNVKGTGSNVTVTVNATATALGLNGTAVNGTGDAANITALTFNEFFTKVNAVDSGSRASQASDGTLRIVSKTGSTGTARTLNGTANAALGFVNQTGLAITTAALRSDTLVPAGTRLGPDEAEETLVVTMQSVTSPRGSTATLVLKVRPALDTGGFAGATTDSVSDILDKPGGQEWTVTNPLALSVALTASQLDARYATALAATVGTSNDTTKKLNAAVSARQSDAIRTGIQSNAIATSNGGHFDRRGFVCPPNGTSAQTAIGATAPSVGAYRDESVSYAVGGVRALMSELLDGGYVTETSPEIIRHPDTFLASRYSSLGAGLNPAQYPENSALRFSQTTFPGLEAAASTWDVETYKAFKAAGVCGAQFDSSTGLVFGDGVTSVDPLAEPTRVNISRRSLAGVIGDTCAGFAGVQVKRQATPDRIDDIRTGIEGFLRSLVPPTGQVVEEFNVSSNPGDAPGITEFTVAASQLASMDTILFNLKVAPGAAELTRA